MGAWPGHALFLRSPVIFFIGIQMGLESGFENLQFGVGNWTWKWIGFGKNGFVVISIVFVQSLFFVRVFVSCLVCVSFPSWVCARVFLK